MSDSGMGVNPSSTPDPTYPNVGVKTPTSLGNSPKQTGKIKIRRPKKKQSAGNGQNASGAVSTSGTAMSAMYKAEGIVEGDFVVGRTSEGVVVGLVEHVMTEGGVYGVPGTEYAIESTPENPAMAVRLMEQEDDGVWCATAYSIGMLMSDATKIPDLDIEYEEDDSEDDSNETDMEDMYGMDKAGYTPNAGMKSAAARAIRWKEQGKANGAGTPVGWGRARDIVAGRAMSLSVVKRMYSFFSRHEVDKKGKDFNNGSNPSNGKIMWDAWGGDAGFAWSRAIVKREMDKSIFSGFGADYTDAVQLTEIFKADTNYANIIPNRSGEPKNKELYNRIKGEAKKKFSVYPSAVANAWVVREYKSRGGKY